LFSGDLDRPSLELPATAAPVRSIDEAINRQMPGFRDELSKLTTVLETGTLRTVDFVKAWNPFLEALSKLPSAEFLNALRTIGGRGALSDPNLVTGLKSAALPFAATSDPFSEEAQNARRKIALGESAFQAAGRVSTAVDQAIKNVGYAELKVLDDALHGTGATIDEVKKKAEDFKVTLDTSFGPGGFAADTSSFKDWARAINAALDGIIAKAQSVGSAISRAVSSATAAQAASGADVTAPPSTDSFFASGGYVRGAGSGTSDSILARVSNGEFVVNSAATSRIGVGYLNHLNSLGRYATGGLVGLPRFAGGGSVSGGTPVHLHFGGRSYQTVAQQSTANLLIQEGRSRQMLSAGARPSWRS
jgi:hypothetical protein